MSFNSDLELVFHRNDLKLVSWGYPKRKNRMHLCFRRGADAYYTINASIRPWKTPEQHDKLFLSAVERELKCWMKRKEENRD